MSAEMELMGEDIYSHDPERIKTAIMSRTQQGRAVAFWCPKRLVLSLPRGVRPWSMFDKKPELAVIVYDPGLMAQNRIAIKYHDSTEVRLTLDDFARCGRVFEKQEDITQVYTLRDPCQRDIHGHPHGQ